MGLFRRDKNHKDAKYKTKEVFTKAEETEQPADEEPSDEEYTDISEAAVDSFSQPQSNNKMEEIYSTRDKHVKFRRQEPLAEEAAAKRKEAAKDDLIRGKLEFSSVGDEDTPEVKLEAELDPNAIVSDEIIEDVVDVKKLRNIYVQDIDDIDVSLDPMESVKEYEKQAQDKQRRDARSAKKKPEEPYVPTGDTVVAKVPVYQHEDSVDKLYLKAGRFTDVVESEYDEYLKSTDPTISKNYHAPKPMVKPHQSLLYTLSQVAMRHKAESEQKQKSKEIMRNNFDEEAPKPKEKKKRSRVGKFFRVLSAVITSGFNSPSEDEQERAMDYSSREDENYILERTRSNIKRQAIHLTLYIVIGLAILGLVIWERAAGAQAVAANGAGTAFTYCGLNFILTIALGVVARHTLIDGVKPLKRFKFNCSTVLALAYGACLLQSLTSLFTCTSFVGSDHHLYSFVAAFGLALNALGRLLMALRVKSNLKFISDRSPAYAAKIYDDEETARRMVSGTTTSKGMIAYQHVTRFLSDFLKISYAPDPSEELSGKMAPIAIIASLFVTILYAIIFKSVQGAVSALAVMLCISIPFTGMLAGNLPLLLFSRRMLKEDAMIAGYPSVRQFCDTSAIMMSASDLFPSGCVTIQELLPLQEYRVSESLLMAAAVLREAASPIAPAFDELVMENNNVLPAVESVMFEDKSGLVGWINGERILIGNMKLMNRYHISIPTDRISSKRKNKSLETSYVAVAGQAVAVLGLSYEASKVTKDQIQKAERSGLALIVSTTDVNVTAELISDRYEVFYRSVKVTAPGYSNVIDEATTKVEEASRAYVATRGRIGSLARAIGGCIGIKSNISLGIVVGIFGMILGILLSATLALYASVARLSIVEVMIYIGFWVAATIIAELIKRP
ncbi:MAG: hypothetical protein IJH40_03040 [Ruminococcus sp.]|uniref:hypothetical protein n=1 Tax=Ruminococcus sp. TaxID=41978 RepID=UPI0028733241|nr:hypothetical protein [Ruminococcus sp.]MBQ3284593.1 hypothetical protein [Ruminococcus sp.]